MISQREITRLQVEVGHEVRERAFVARESRERAVPRKSLADEIAEEWEELDRPMREGWNVYSTPVAPGSGRRRKRMR